MRFDFVEIESVEQIIRAVSAASANNRPDVISGEHFLQFTGPAICGAGEVEILFRDGVEIKGLVSEFRKRPAASIKQFPFNIACGSDDSDGVARLKRGRLDARDGWARRHRYQRLGRSILTGRRKLNLLLQ